MQGSDAELTRAEAQRILRVTPGMMAALITSGLLGHCAGGRVQKEAVDHFLRYGTQWRPSLGDRRTSEEIIRNMPPVEGEHQPVGSTTLMMISPNQSAAVDSDADTGWLAQFYVRPNHFMFSDPTASALIGPIGLKLASAKMVGGLTFPVTLYPDPTGAFAMAMVWGESAGHPDLGQDKAYDAVSPVLDRLSFLSDQPLPIAQAIIIGVPSGSILFSLPRPPQTVSIEDLEETDYFSAPQELTNAIALYREGISSNNPFHQFLTLWKSYESSDEARREWRKTNFKSVSDTRNDIIVDVEVIPKVFAASSSGGSKFGIVKEQLRSSYRNSIAHGTSKYGRPKTPATSKDFSDVYNNVFMIRYMARVSINNAIASIRSTSK